MSTTPLFYLLTQTTLSQGELGERLVAHAPPLGGTAETVKSVQISLWLKDPKRMPRWARLAAFRLAVANGYQIRSFEEQIAAIRSARILDPDLTFEGFAGVYAANIGECRESDLRAAWYQDSAEHA